jgi:hypothetical protein
VDVFACSNLISTKFVIEETGRENYKLPIFIWFTEVKVDNPELQLYLWKLDTESKPAIIKL